MSVIVARDSRGHGLRTALTPGTGDLPLFRAEEVLCGPAPFTAEVVVPASNVWAGETLCVAESINVLLPHQTSDSSRGPKQPAKPSVSTLSAADHNGSASERPGAAHASPGDAACC